MASDGQISLADSVAGLREELEVAARRQDAASRAGDVRLVPPLQITSIIMETEVLVGRDETIGGKLGYWIASAEGSRTKHNTSKVKVTINLQPLGRVNPETGREEPVVLGPTQECSDVT